MSRDEHAPARSPHAEPREGPPYHYLVLAAVFAVAAIAMPAGHERSHERPSDAAKPAPAAPPARPAPARGAISTPRRDTGARPARRHALAGSAPDAAPGAAPPEPSAPPPPAGELDRTAAKASLAEAAAKAAYCRRGGDPGGVATVAVTFLATGKVGGAAVTAPATLADTPTAQCIAGRMRGATVPAFEGKPVTLMHRVHLY
jgi:hypothetical protein